MTDQSHTLSGGIHIDGVFVMGMYGSGLGLLDRLYRRLGLRSVDASEPGPLAEFNDRLLEILGGSRQKLPSAAPREVARILRPFRDEARELFENILGSSATSEGTGPPWVWADSRLCMLASFWKKALAISPAVVLVHRDPAALELESAELARFGGADDVFSQWDRCNRAAMVQCFESPASVLRYESLLEQPKTQVDLTVDFLQRCGVSLVDGGVEQAVEALESVTASSPDGPLVPLPESGKGYRVLERILEQMDGIHVDPGHWETKSDDLLENVAAFYDEDYYGASYDSSGVPYTRDEKQWVDFFSSIAKSIVSTLRPQTALDVGCATGILVEAMRNLGVDARGIDVSRWAIAQVPDNLKPYFTVGTITDELDGHYDLLTCFEVVEHLPAFAADNAIANMCRHTDAILFSSTPDDFDETTHLNVEPAGYWAQLFFRHGFLRDVDYDASFLTPNAVLFRRRTLDIEELVGEYERAVANVTTILGTRAQDAVAEHDQLATRFNSLASDHHLLTSEHDQNERELASLRASFTELERRRTAEVLAAHEAMRQYEHGQQQLSSLVESRDAELAAIRQTKTFRYTTSLRRLYGRLRRPTADGEATPNLTLSGQGASYDLWVEQFDTLDESVLATIRDRLAGLKDQPLVSVILPVYNTRSDYLKAAIDSVVAQLYANWELCVSDDGSTEPHVAEILTAYEARDQRIRVVWRPENGHISAASNSALDVTTGEWIAPLDHDDVLPEHALALAVLALAEHEDPGLLYSDEDKIDAAGRRHSPNFKPDFDPLLLLGQNYLSHLTLLRRDLVVAAGGYREGFEGSQDWDLVLRVSEGLAPEQVVHVPHVLYHWRSHAASTAALLSAKPYAANAGRRSVVEHLERLGLQASVSQIALSGHNRVRWKLPDPTPLVSVVIPTKDGPLLQRCIDSVLSFTTYPNFEIVVIDNGSQQLATLEYLREREGLLTVIRDDRPFNYSALNNAAVQRASGSVICLLNDDTEVISEDWLNEMVGQLFQADVGAVGAKLYYSDGRIQHAGIILGIGGVAGHSHRGTDRLSSGYFGRLLTAQNVSAVTGACMVVRREAWSEVGGLNEEHLAIAFNDVDFGIRLRQAGWRIVWTPDAEMYHHESISRGPDTVGDRIHEFPKEVKYVEGRWSTVLRNDPAYNPNLSLVTEDFALAWPPRISYR